MSLKILIADDSMTAQNMGKKILADAGFVVVPVSNGAAAMKKIAETKPDIIVVDIFMPGYTGLEVCEKVKNAPETANVPVLLTVGKLEPYRPEEGAKVRAEGVIIKPFEASELLSAIGRIAEKYNLNVPQIEPVEIDAVENAPQEFSMNEAAPLQAAAAAVPAFVESVSAPVEEQKPEVPSFIREASAAAAAPAPMFIIEDSDDLPGPAYNLSDLIGSHSESPAYHMDEAMSAADIEVPEPEPPVAFSASSIPDPTATGSWHIGNSARSIVDEALDSIASVGSSEVTQLDPALETTAAEKVEAHVENLAELEAASEGPIEIEPTVDPAFVTDPEEMMKFTIKVGTENERAVSEESAEQQESIVAEAMPEVEAPAGTVGDDTAEFAGEPQTAHSFHDDPMVQMGAIIIDDSSAPAEESAPTTEVGDDTMKLSLHSVSGLEGALHEFEATEEPAAVAAEEPVAETPAEPWESIVAAEPEPEPAQEAVSSFAPESTYPANVVAEMAAASPELEHEPEVIVVPEPPHEYASVESAIDSVVEEQKDDTKTLAVAAGMDTSMVARAVQKVFERYREQMVADIADELRKGE